MKAWNTGKMQMMMMKCIWALIKHMRPITAVGSGKMAMECERHVKCLQFTVWETSQREEWFTYVQFTELICSDGITHPFSCNVLVHRLNYTSNQSLIITTNLCQLTYSFSAKVLHSHFLSSTKLRTLQFVISLNFFFSFCASFLQFSVYSLSHRWWTDEIKNRVLVSINMRCIISREHTENISVCSISWTETEMGGRGKEQKPRASAHD